MEEPENESISEDQLTGTSDGGDNEEMEEPQRNEEPLIDDDEDMHTRGHKRHRYPSSGASSTRRPDDKAPRVTPSPVPDEGMSQAADLNQTTDSAELADPSSPEPRTGPSGNYQRQTKPDSVLDKLARVLP